MGSSEYKSRHDQLMARAVSEARKGTGSTRPNPLVGCVAVRDGEVVASAHHVRSGEPHAEIEVLRQLDDASEPVDLYVNLEPCCHTGRTPPCTDSIVDANVRRVYVGIRDPNPRVNGRGIERLRSQGVEVVEGVLAEQCYALNQPFLKLVTTGKPWVEAKYAMSLDGKIATRNGESKWISSDGARARVHKLRGDVDAVMVGTGTFLSDNPRLTARVDGARDPDRVVLDADLDGPVSANVFGHSESEGHTVVCTAVGAGSARQRETLREKGCELWEFALDQQGRFSLTEVLDKLGENDVVRLLVEGGGSLHGSLFDEELVDGVHAFVSPKIIGGGDATPAVGGTGVATMEQVRELREPSIDVLEQNNVVVTGQLERRCRRFTEPAFADLVGQQFGTRSDGA